MDYYRGLLALRRKFQAYGTCEPDCKKTFFRENQIAGYELEYPDGHAVCVFYMMLPAKSMVLLARE